MDVFAYGTLMVPEVISRVTGQVFPHLEAHLRGYACFLVGNEVFPGLIPRQGAITQGLLYLDIDGASLARIDSFEGSVYERCTVTVIVKGGARREAHAYVLRQKYAHLLSSNPWDVQAFMRNHLDGFLKGLDR